MDPLKRNRNCVCANFLVIKNRLLWTWMVNFSFAYNAFEFGAKKNINRKCQPDAPSILYQKVIDKWLIEIGFIEFGTVFDRTQQMMEIKSEYSVKVEGKISIQRTKTSCFVFIFSLNQFVYTKCKLFFRFDWDWFSHIRCSSKHTAKGQLQWNEQKQRKTQKTDVYKCDIWLRLRFMRKAVQTEEDFEFTQKKSRQQTKISVWNLWCELCIEGRSIWTHDKTRTTEIYTVQMQPTKMQSEVLPQMATWCSS